jgi:proteasome beta subunit
MTSRAGAPWAGGAGLTGPYQAPGTSFLEFAQAVAPDLLPGASRGAAGAPETPTATTIVALTSKDGLVMAGDRRATIGHAIASREMEKVFPADSTTAIGVAGSAGLAVELVRLFQLELEHYEKVDGAPLSLLGKANRLAAIVKANLPMAFQGLAVLPLLGGVEPAPAGGVAPRLFSYDVTGGHYAERDYAAIGSGSVYARGSLKKLYKPGMAGRQAARVALRALIDAADDDSATAGPDWEREIWPVVAMVDKAGYRRLADPEVAGLLGRGAAK